ncbi:hypothetical protein [Halocatena marina]|uniref:hypothetical protein n=1 Tax=Halocatena marina TaxID=2934937 RepID=UPI00200FB23C|nr:hypothetical protein [Halocatena marina]
MSSESAVRRIETYYSRETLDSRGRPQTTTDPEWRLYSSVVNTTEPSPEKDFGLRRGLGHDNPHDKNQAQETHELTVEYELERFPHDAGGNSVDPIGDAAARTADNELQYTHSFLQITQKDQILTRNTVHRKWFDRPDIDPTSHPSGSDPGAESRDTRKYIYGRGGRPEEAVLGIDASDNALCVVECPYQFQMVRPYQWDQPINGFLHVVSTDPSDTDLSVELENVDASETASVTTDAADATTAVASSSELSSLGTIWVPDEHVGSILVYDDDGSGAGSAGEPAQLLGVVKGTSLYDGIDYDSGTPPLGSGSFDDGTSLEGKQYAIGAEVLWNGRAIADYHQGSSLTISNDMGEEAATDTGFEIARQVGTQEVTSETTAFGETASNDNFEDFVEGREGEYQIQLTDGNITLSKAFLSEGTPASSESGEAFLLPESTFTALEDIDNSREAIEFSHT